MHVHVTENSKTSIICELFVPVTNRLEEAHEQSIAGHVSIDRDAALATINDLHAKIDEIRILLNAIEALAASDGS